MPKHLIISILPVLASLFWVIVNIFDKRKDNRRTLLIIFFICTTIIYSCHTVFYNNFYSLYQTLDSLWIFASLMVYPIFHIYIRLLTTEDKLGWGWIWFALPLAMIALISVVLYVLMTPEEAEAFVKGVLYKQSGYETDSLLVQLQTLRIYVVQIAFTFQVVATLYFGLKLIKQYNIKLDEFYSSSNGGKKNAMKFFLVIFILVSFFSGIINILGKSYFIEQPHLLIIPSIVFTFTLLVLGYISYTQHFSIGELLKESHRYDYIHSVDEFDTARASSEFNHIEIPKNDSLKNQIRYLLEVVEIYKYKELKLADLSLLLKTNRTYISNSIREDFDSSFSELVNSYRVKHAVKLLKNNVSNVSLSMSEIASQSGFSSKSSFFRVFKEKTGVTPGKYRV